MTRCVHDHHPASCPAPLPGVIDVKLLGQAMGGIPGVYLSAGIATGSARRCVSGIRVASSTLALLPPSPHLSCLECFLPFPSLPFPASGNRLTNRLPEGNARIFFYWLECAKTYLHLRRGYDPFSRV